MDTQNLDTSSLVLTLQQLMTVDRPAEEKIERALEIGAAYLHIDTGLVVQTIKEGDTWEAIVSTDKDNGQFPEGTTLDLSNTYCRRVVEDDADAAFLFFEGGWARVVPNRFLAGARLCGVGHIDGAE